MKQSTARSSHIGLQQCDAQDIEFPSTTSETLLDTTVFDVTGGNHDLL